MFFYFSDGNSPEFDGQYRQAVVMLKSTALSSQGQNIGLE